MTNVVPFPSPPERPPPNNEVVAQLEVLLNLAKQGSIQSFAYLAIGQPEGTPAVGFSGPHRNAMMAGAVLLVDALRWKPM